MKKFIIVFSLSLFILFTSNAYETYKQVKIYIPDQATFQKLIKTGIDLEGAEGKIGDWFELVVSHSDYRLLQELGFTTVTIIDDYSKFLENRLYKGPYNALGFGYGSMGGYYTYNEIIQQLDSMKFLYPSLITSKQIIGTSIEGRNVFAVKISDNPDLNEADEPAVLYTALTHAREPQGMMTVLYYMWWLLENYNTNPEANYIVNNRQLWFIPVINPDGYVHNQNTNPNGGGMWRKNRRNNGDGSFGVDLNRNFGPFAYWNAPNGGSSTTPSSETYRGTAPFSEPETQNIRNFLAGKNIRAALNYHTYSNLLIYPYGALVRETPDSLIYREYAKDMTQYNGYVYGTDQQTVGYATRGNSDDYMYDGDIPANGKIFAMTPEVGSSSDGFWPPTARILPLALENLFPNKYISKAVGAFPQVSSYTFIDSSGDNFLERGEKFSISVLYRNKGLDSAKNLTIQLYTSNNDLIIPGEQININYISPLSNHNINLECRIKNRATTGVNSKIFLTTTDNLGYISYDTINVFIGKLNLAFSDSANNGTINWNTGISWGLSSDAQSPPFSFTDSPSGNYPNYADNSLTLLNNLKLSTSSVIKLQFSAKWNIERKYDFLTVEFSSNGGTSWSTVKGKYNKPGSGSGVQTIGTFGYDGVQTSWVEEEMDVTAFASTQFKFRFRLRSDGYITADGFYVDNIRLLYGKVDSAKYSNIALNTNELDFGNVKLNQSKDSLIIIENLSPSNDSLRGNLQLKYGIDFTLNSDTNFSIPQGSHKNISITFSPQSVGLIQDTLIVYHSSDILSSPVLIPLQGTGVNFISYKFLADIKIQNHSNIDTLYFGAEEGATDGLDLAFGEFELDDLPPNGVFDTRWLIQETNGSKVDVRDTLSNDNIKNVYKLRYQLSTDNDTITFRWDKDKLSDGSFILKDSATNGALVSINMKKIDSLKIFGEDASPLLIFHEINPLLIVKVNRGWNLVSIPTELEQYSKNYVFPGSSSSAFGYNSSGYYSTDTLSIGNGYWIKFNLNREYLFTTPQILLDTITLQPGWNLIGALGKGISVENIETDPVNIISSPFYGYDNGYKLIDTLKPGAGFWVKSRESGKLILSALTYNKIFSKTILDYNKTYWLEIKDSNNSFRLYFTEQNLDKPDYYILPPIPPADLFDVRFASQYFVEVLDGKNKNQAEIKIQSPYYPVTISWNEIDTKNLLWSLKIISSNGKISEYPLKNKSQVLINNSDERIYLTASILNEDYNTFPTEYSLQQNYPNPFNSRTLINYTLPENSFVTLKLYDLLGREIQTLINEYKQAGYHKFEFDADKLPSGIYFYKLQTGKFIDIKKMVLIK